MELVTEPFPLRCSSKKCWRNIVAFAGSQGADLHLHLDRALPEAVSGDRLRLKQILGNLLSNAVKFTTGGGVAITAESVETTKTRTVLRFSVSDTGIGLAPELITKLFQPFTQADSSITRKYGGTGLGLAISRQLSEMMGGTLGAENNSDGGATFHLTIPFPLPAAQPQPTVTPTRRGDSRPASEKSGCRVLLAEDDSTNRSLLGLLLERLGHQPTAVEDGRQAVTLLSQEPFDLVLMDVSMPELDGLNATREVRAFAPDHPNRAIPVIALTAHARREDREEFLKAGMSEVLAKPFTIEALEATIRKFSGTCG